MPFTEAIKLEAKRKAHFSCVVCHQAFVEVHHILPQADGGSDDLDNAAPLCASCHDLFGANPDKRKQIRQMRDFWYEVCETRFRDSPSLELNQKIDEIKTRQHEHGAMLSGIKDLLGHFYAAQTSQIATAATASQVTAVSGVYIPDPAKRTSGAFTSEDIKSMEGQFKRDPNDPIDWDHFHLRPEDM